MGEDDRRRRPVPAESETWPDAEAYDSSEGREPSYGFLDAVRPEEAWEEEDEELGVFSPPEGDLWDSESPVASYAERGDGPFPAVATESPLEAAIAGVDRFRAQVDPGGSWDRAPGLGDQSSRLGVRTAGLGAQPLGEPRVGAVRAHRLERRRPKHSNEDSKSPDRSALARQGRADRAKEDRRGQKLPSPPRLYPKMRALLADPSLVVEGSDPLPEPLPPPVPGTFIANPPPRPPRAAAGDLDGMLSLMAEGLLIGEGPDGSTEIRISLKDEFFAGTELRIRLDDGRIAAALYPPSREVYWQLGGEAGELRARLEARGLRVQSLEVIEPS